MTQKIVSFFHKNWSLILVIIISLLPIIFFKKGLLLSAGEGIKDLDINNYFKYYDLYAWRNQINPGELNVWMPHLFIFDAFFYGLGLIGFSLKTTQIFWFIFLWMSAGLSIYFLVKTIAHDHRYKIWGFFTALLYLFNTFTMFKPIDENFRLVHVAMPLMLIFFISGLKENKSTTKYALLIGLSSLIFASSSVNPPAVFTIFISLFLYLCFDILINKRLSIKKISFLLKILFFYILLNFWWMVITIPGMVNSNKSLREIMVFSSLSTMLFEAFRFLGSWAFRASHEGVDYFPYYSFYYGKGVIVIFMSFFIPILAFSSLLFKKINKYIIFFSSLTLVGIFLVKGSAAPFGQVFKFVWGNVPGFWIFREPFTKFTPLVVFASSIIFGYTISEISKKIYLNFKNGQKRLIQNFLFLFCIFLIVCISAFPIFSGQIFRKESIRSMKSQYIKFPQYWLDLSYWFENYDKTNKVLVTPKSGYGAYYDWEYGIGIAGPVTTLLVPNPTLLYRGTASNMGEKLVNNLYRYFQPQSKKRIANYLALFGVKYILQQNDLSLNNVPANTYPPNIMSNFLKKQEEIELFNQFDKLDLYKVKDDYFLPYFYVPKSVIYANGNINSLINITGFKDYELRSGIYFSDTKEIIPSKIDKIFIKKSPENKIIKEELCLFSFSVKQLPYVRRKPEGFFYLLVLKKEEYDKWKVRKEPERLFEKYLFYSDKRIAEIVNYGDKIRESSIRQSLDNYKKEVTAALEILKNLKSEDNKDFEKLLIEYKSALALHQKEIKVKNEFEYWSMVILDLEKKVDELKINHDFSKLFYKIDIPESGEYEILAVENEEENNLGKRYFEKGSEEFTLTIKGMNEKTINDNLQIKNYLPNYIYEISFDYQASESGTFFVRENDNKDVLKINYFSTGDQFEHLDTYFQSSQDATNAAIIFSDLQSENVKISYKNLKVNKISQPDLILRKNIVENSELSKKNQNPKITFVKINPTKYRIKIEGANDPYTLIFSESFNKGWKAYINEKWKINNEEYYRQEIANYFDGQIKEEIPSDIFLDKNIFETWGYKPISEDRHLLVNGYANSWYIIPEDVDGKQDYELVIEFAPQRLFYIGLFISGLTLVGCLGYLIFNYFSKIFRKK